MADITRKTGDEDDDDNGTVERLIPIHPELWDRIETEAVESGLRSRRKQVQLILLKHYGMDVGQYLISGNKDPRIAEARSKKNGKKRA